MRNVLGMGRGYEISGIRVSNVKLQIKMTVEEKTLDDQEEADVLNMVEQMSSPHDQCLGRLDLSTQGILGHPHLHSATLVMFYSQALDLLAMSHNSTRREEMLEGLLTCPLHGHDLSSRKQEDCLAKMIYSG